MLTFTLLRPDGSRERRRFVPFTVKQTGPSEWTATDPRDGRVIGRNFVSEQALRERCGSIHEPADPKSQPTKDKT